MTGKQWLGFSGIGPFSKPFAPPLVILGDRMKLGEVKGYQARRG
jgi:hypothetical protein